MLTDRAFVMALAGEALRLRESNAALQPPTDCQSLLEAQQSLLVRGAGHRGDQRRFRTSQRERRIFPSGGGWTARSRPHNKMAWGLGPDAVTHAGAVRNGTQERKGLKLG